MTAGTGPARPAPPVDAGAVVGAAAATGLGAREAALAVVTGAAAWWHGPADELADPWLPGAVYEHLLDPGGRRRGGVHYTPRAVAEELTALAVADLGVTAEGDPPTVCDPAMGCGSFLLAAAEHLHALGFDRSRVARCLHGADLDPGAVAVARAVLTRWAGDATRMDERLVVADGLRPTGGPWAGGARFDLVLGNPPFLGQLSAPTRRSAAEREVAEVLVGGRAGYVDAAGLFWLRALELTAPGGRVLLLAPLSLLATRDAAPVRAALAAAGTRAVWLGRRELFAARVRVCAPLVAPGTGPAAEVDLVEGPGARPHGRAPLPPAGQPWSGLAATVAGVPDASGLRTAGTVGDRARATAGFRDLFYALAGAVVEGSPAADGGAPDDAELAVVTAGLVDPLRSRWGRAPARLGGRRWDRPVLPVARIEDLPPAVGAWVRARLVPKVLVATQTRVVEAFPDVEGRIVPCTPVVSVEPTDGDVWALAAVLTAPPLSVLAARAAAGAALHPDALKLSAAQILRLPLPADADAWQAGAALCRRAVATPDPAAREVWIDELGRVMTGAYGAGREVLDWWSARRPRHTA